MQKKGAYGNVYSMETRMCPNSILNLFSFIVVTAFGCVEGHYQGVI